MRYIRVISLETTKRLHVNGSLTFKDMSHKNVRLQSYVIRKLWKIEYYHIPKKGVLNYSLRRKWGFRSFVKRFIGDFINTNNKNNNINQRLYRASEQVSVTCGHFLSVSTNKCESTRQQIVLIYSSLQIKFSSSNFHNIIKQKFCRECNSIIMTFITARSLSYVSVFQYSCFIRTQAYGSTYLYGCVYATTINKLIKSKILF
jgi:hypothetical protein